MKKYLPIFIYGSIIILVGFFLLFLGNSSFKLIKIILGVSLIVGAIFAFITAFSRQRNQVHFAYHEIHALAMLVYGITLLSLCNSFEKLYDFTAFLFIFYTFSEIMFCNWLFNMEQKVVLKVVAIRVLLGFMAGIGAIVAMNYTDFTIQIFGVLFIMVGINIILYVPIIKNFKSIQVLENY
jgi:uncharacterized membrane protein HdeD (DUF308 family)